MGLPLLTMASGYNIREFETRGPMSDLFGLVDTYL